VDRCAIFLDDDDREHPLRLLRTTCVARPIALDACVHGGIGSSPRVQVHAGPADLESLRRLPAAGKAA
jgi:hypothetical protein